MGGVRQRNRRPDDQRPHLKRRPSQRLQHQGRSLRILLDTNALIWWLTEPGKLTRRADQAMRSRENSLLVSIVSLWELSMKIRARKLTVLGSSIQYVVDEMQAQRIATLPVTLAHLYRHEHLDPIHRDPFDRMIVAQALAENVPVITSDRFFPQYGVDILW